MNKALHHQIQSRSDYGTQNKRRLPQMLHRSPIIPTGLHYWSTGNRTTQRMRSSLSSSLSLVASSARFNGTCKLVFGSICESRGLSNLTPSRSRLFKLIGRVKGMRWSCSKHWHIWWLTYAKRARREGKARSRNYDQEVILEQPTSNITPTPCSLSGLRREETITVTHAVDVF